MKTGTVKWFNLQGRYGVIELDEGGPFILAHMPAIESAGMNDLKPGQRISFEVQRDDRRGDLSAVSLAPLVSESSRDEPRSSQLYPMAAASRLDGRSTVTNPFGFISALTLSGLWARLRP
jgi:cold shock protein